MRFWRRYWLGEGRPRLRWPYAVLQVTLFLLVTMPFFFFAVLGRRDAAWMLAFLISIELASAASKAVALRLQRHVDSRA